MAMAVERGSYVETGRVEILHARNPRLEDMTGFPKLGALVHVLVEPLIPNWQMELLNKKSQLGMEGSEKRKCPLKELNRHEVV